MRSTVLWTGSLMLGNRGQCFECGHEHGEGDRCVSFWYAPDYFERLAADAGTRGVGVDFTVPRLPPLGPLSPLVACAGAGVTGSGARQEAPACGFNSVVEQPRRQVTA